MRGAGRAISVVVGLALVVVTLLNGVTAAPAGAAGGPRVVSSGHVDAFALYLEGRALALGARVDGAQGGADRADPAHLVLHLTDSQRRQAPSAPAFAFLGVAPGADVWVIPQSYQPGVLWAGWTTQTLPADAGVVAATVTLEGLRGPGALELYASDVEGPVRLLSSTTPGLGTLALPVNSHAHGTWAFTAPGTYQLDVSADATLAGGQVLRAPTVTYTVVVGGSTLGQAQTSTVLGVEVLPDDDPQDGVLQSSMARLTATVSSPAGASALRGEVEFVQTVAGTVQALGRVATDDQGTAVLDARVSAEAETLGARFVPWDTALVAGSQAPAVDNPVLATGSAVVAGLQAGYQVGDTISLRAVAPSVEDASALAWYSRGAQEALPVQRGTGPTVELTAAAELDGATLWFETDAAMPGDAVIRSRPGTGRVAQGPTVTPSPSPTSEASPSPTASPTPATAAAPSPGAPTADAVACLPTPVTTTVAASDVEIVTRGHFDLGLTVQSGTAAVLAKDDRTGAALWRDPAGYVFHLADAASTPVPSGELSEFLGSGPVWTIPLSQRADVPWIGWNTQHPSVAGRTAGDVTMTLTTVSGPGDLAIYDLATLGTGVGQRHLGTAPGFPRSTTVPVGASGVHVHAIWAFTAPGAYTVTLKFSGTVDGAPVSASTDLAFFAGPGDPRSAVRPGTITEYVGRTATGKECDLELAATGVADDTVEGIATLAVGLVALGLTFVAASAGRTANPRRRREFRVGPAGAPVAAAVLNL